MVRAQVLEFVRNLAPHHHSVFFYDSLEDKHEVLAVFVEAGLENGELVIYVASEETPRQITEALKGYGVDAGHEGLRILNFDQWYVIDGSSADRPLRRIGRRPPQRRLSRATRDLGQWVRQPSPFRMVWRRSSQSTSCPLEAS